MKRYVLDSSLYLEAARDAASTSRARSIPSRPSRGGARRVADPLSEHLHGKVSALYHYHVLALDGVVSGDGERAVRFHEASGLEARDAEALARTVQLRVLRWFARRGLLDASAAADMRTWRGTGGFSVDGSVRIEGEDRAGPELLERWAQLLARIYEVLPLVCPVCGGEMRIISFITLPSTVERILLHLDLPHRAPRVSPARGPPQAELDLDQSPAFDLAVPDPVPEFEFDQSPPQDWEI